MNQLWSSRGTVCTVAALSVLVGVLSASSVAIAEEDDKKPKYIQRISARAYTLAGGSSKTFNVEIGIKRWTTDDERANFLDAIKEGGTEGLTKAFVEAEDLGFIRFSNGYESLRYAYEFKQGDKRTIIFATDRPVRYGEVSRGLRSGSYTVSMGTIELDEKNKGSGTIAPYCEVEFNEETQRLDVGNFGIQPFRLTSVKGKNPK